VFAYCFLKEEKITLLIDWSASHFNLLHNALLYVASISYALYVFHMPTMYAVEHFLGNIANFSPFYVFVISLLSSFLLAHIFELLIQPAFMHRVQRHIKSTA